MMRPRLCCHWARNIDVDVDGAAAAGVGADDDDDDDASNQQISLKKGKRQADKLPKSAVVVVAAAYGQKRGATSALFLAEKKKSSKSSKKRPRHCARQFVKMIDCRLNNENRELASQKRTMQQQTGKAENEIPN